MAITFSDGTGDNITWGTAGPWENKGQGTFMSRFRLASGGTNTRIWGNWDTTVPDRGLLFGLHSSGYLSIALACKDGATTEKIRAFRNETTGWRDDEWHTVAWRWEYAAGSHNRGCWVDGSEVSTTTWLTAWTTQESVINPDVAAPIHVGAQGDASDSAGVDVATCSYHHAYLSDQDMAALSGGAPPSAVEPHNLLLWIECYGDQRAVELIGQRSPTFNGTLETVDSSANMSRGPSWSPANFTPRYATLAGSGFSSVAENALFGKDVTITLHNAEWVG